MVPESPLNSNVARVGQLILDDIQRRGLAAGSPYMTADAAGREFGFSPQLVGRAMRVLAERGVLIRRAGVGTFVGPSAETDVDVRQKCIHALISGDLLQADFSAGEVAEGLMASLPGYSVQVNALPSHSPAATMRKLVQEGSSVGWMGGLVLVGCPREVQELAVSLDVPAAVFGGVYATARSLPSVDADLHQTGRLMAEHMVDAGHERIALLMRDTWLPGDHQALEGINEVLAAAGLSQGALQLRALPADTQVLAAEIRHLLESPQRPTGLICRSRFFGDAARRAAEQAGLRIGEDLALISDARNIRTNRPADWPEVLPTASFQDHAQRVGTLLAERIDDPRCAAKHEVIPVRLVPPGEA